VKNETGMFAMIKVV